MRRPPRIPGIAKTRLSPLVRRAPAVTSTRLPAAGRARMGIRVPVKVQVPRRALLVRFILSPWGRAFVATLTVFTAVCLGVFVWFYVKYARLIDEKLAAGPFANTSMLFAAPRSVDVGEEVNAQQISAELRRSGGLDEPMFRTFLRVRRERMGT